MMLCNYTDSPTASLQKQMVLNNEEGKAIDKDGARQNNEGCEIMENRF